MAGIAIISGIQTFRMFAGFAAGGDTIVAGNTIFHEAGVIYRGSEKCRRALMTNAAILRRDDVADVLAFCFRAVMAERAGA